jgi:cytochrome c biogenesis protein CcdA/thiol-disulfide isomerase/thioredoxin
MLINSHSALALAEGFGLAFSPCILPILPFILAASAVGSRWRPFVIIAGFIVSFTAFALVARKVVALTGVGQDTIQWVAYGLLLLFGLTMVVPFIEERFAAWTNKIASGAQDISSGKRAEGFWGALLVGALIGIVWTPCAGPILAAALLQVIQAQTNLDAIITMSAFSIGASIPMLAIALFGQQLSHRIRAFSKHATVIRRGMGLLIICFALFGLFGVNIGAWAVQNEGVDTVSEAQKAGDVTIPVSDAPQQNAPEIAGITQWFNSEPLAISQLKGKVVLVDFWTYSCINCIRTLPYIESWYEKYKDQGLVVIGVHSPEFPFEGKPDNVAMAIRKLGITYPVAMDNDFATWKNYDNKYWPAHYLIDRNGKIVETHFGEGGYAETENAIRGLLGFGKIGGAPDAVVSTPMQTPETYLGYKRAENFISPEETSEDKPQNYTYPPDQLDKNEWALQGGWTIAGDRITSGEANSSLRLDFTARKVFLVLGTSSGHPIKATLKLNGVPIGDAAGKDVSNGTITIDQVRLYELVDQHESKNGILEITADAPSLEAYAFTFGN